MRVLVFLFPSALLITLYLLCIPQKIKLILISVLWIVLNIFLMTFAFFTWSSTYEITRFGNVLLIASSIYLNAPILLVSVMKNWNKIMTIVLAVVFGFVSFYSIAFLLLFTEQIWGV